MCMLATQSYLTRPLCGLLQARILQWVAIFCSRRSSRPRNWTQVSCIAGRSFTIWTPGEPTCAQSLPSGDSQPDPNEETTQQGGLAGDLADGEQNLWSEGPLVSSYDSTLVWDETLKGAVVQVVISIKRLYILVGERETPWFNRPGFAYCLILAPLICKTWNKSFIFLYLSDFVRASFGGSVVKTPPANAGDAGSNPSLGRSPGEGNGNPLQYCCLEIPWMKEPGGLQSMGLQRIRLNWVTEHDHDFVRPETPSTT